MCQNNAWKEKSLNFESFLTELDIECQGEPSVVYGFD